MGGFMSAMNSLSAILRTNNDAATSNSTTYNNNDEFILCPVEGISARVIEGNLLVQKGSTCGIGIGSFVTGNVTVQPGGRLNLFFASIGENIDAEDATVKIADGFDVGAEGPSRVFGDIYLKRGGALFISATDLEVSGEVHVEGGGSIAVDVSDGTFRGKVEVKDSESGTVNVSGATFESGLFMDRGVLSSLSVIGNDFDLSDLLISNVNVTNQATVSENDDIRELRVEASTFQKLTIGGEGRNDGNQVWNGTTIVENVIGTSANVQGNRVGGSIQVTNNTGGPATLVCTDNKQGCSNLSNPSSCIDEGVDAINNDLALFADQCMEN